MRTQDDLELFKKRNRSMMFFLCLDVTTHLRNLRLTHGESAISFLPGESRSGFEGSRNPTGGIRFQFAYHFGERLILPQLRQDVNVISGSVDDQRDSILFANRSAEVLMDSRSDCCREPRLPTFGRKDNVIQKIAIGGTHGQGPFRRPCSGAVFFLHITPGVSLRSTPGFIPSHHSGALMK